MKLHITVKSGTCNGKYHQTGHVFTIENTTPGGMCLGLWNTIAPYVTALRSGGNFSWEKEEGFACIHCPDPKGITVEIRREK